MWVFFFLEIKSYFIKGTSILLSIANLNVEFKRRRNGHKKKEVVSKYWKMHHVSIFNITYISITS